MMVKELGLRWYNLIMMVPRKGITTQHKGKALSPCHNATQKEKHTMMRSTSSPRRFYIRAGAPLLSYGGKFFGPANGAETKMNIEKEVRAEVVDPSHIKVTQRHGKKPATVETWKEIEVVRIPRGSKKDATPAAEGAPAPSESTTDVTATG
jgi:hypothetical protein